MIILGVGTDLVSVDRIRRLWSRYGTRALERILSEREYLVAESLRDPTRFLAMRFAGKEAVSKALGTGFRGLISLQAMTILPDALGKPTVSFSDDLRNELQRRRFAGIEISLADDGGWALAFAIAWAKEGADPERF